MLNNKHFIKWTLLLCVFIHFQTKNSANDKKKTRKLTAYIFMALFFILFSGLKFSISQKYKTEIYLKCFHQSLSSSVS